MNAEFRILGPLEVELGAGGAAPVPRGRARTLACLLLIERGAVVPLERIVDSVWAEAPPANARNAVQVVASRLRTALGADVVVSEGGSYRIPMPPATLDAERFQTLLERGRRELAEDLPGEAAATLRAALALWRGPALADVRDRPFAQPEIVRLDALRLTCQSERIAADLAAGAADDLTGELAALVLEHPLDERLRELQMLALYRADRPADALEAYRDARRTLLDGLGLEPGQALRTLETAILRGQVPGPADARPAPADPSRRQVTCLCARLISPDRPGAADPEQLGATVERLHQLVRTTCARYGGRISEFRSDGALIAFGTPVSHEDDALRALRAALQLRVAAPDLAVGIATGVIVSSGQPTETVLVGAPVSDADALARGRQEVRLAPSTWALVEHAAGATPAGGGWYRLDRLLPGAPAIRRDLERPLVGRARELDALLTAYRRAGAGGEWQRVMVVGEPGIGKSRLLAELPATLPQAAVILTGRCPPPGESTTYGPIRELLAQAYAGRPPEEAAAALREPAGAEARRSLRRLLADLSRELPVVVVIDDAQWAHPALLDLLDELTGAPGAGCGLLVCLARPELADALSGSTRLELPPLSAAESGLLLDHVARTLPPAGRRRIATTAAGNPLFLEQLAGYLDETGDEAGLPPAIRGLLAARLDLLEDGERATLRLGSIQGDRFTAESVHALADERPLAEIEAACASLVRRRLLSEEAGLGFRHALIRAAAYESISKSARARLHQRHAGWLIDGGGEQPDLETRVAFQLEAAHRCASEIGATDAGDLAGRARQALVAAAGIAHRGGDLPGEIGLLERALAVDGGGDQRAELLTALASALFAAGSFDRATAIADEAVALAHALGLRQIHSRALIERERLRVYQEQATIDVAASMQISDRALGALRRAGDDLGMARAHYLRCELLWMGGDPEAGYASAEQMLACADRAGIGFEASAAVGFMAWSLVLGLTPVPAALERCRQLEARLAGDRVAGLEIGGFWAVLHAMCGRFGRARREMAESRAGLADLGLRQACAYMALFDAQLELLAGDAEAAVRAVRDAERTTAETGDRWFQATVCVDLALARLRRPGEAEATQAVRAIDAIPAPADAEWVIKRLCARALLAARTGELDLAAGEARAATAAADQTNLIVFRADAHRTLAEVLAQAGDAGGAAAAADEARRLCDLKGNSAAAAEIRRLRSRIRDPLAT